MGNYVPIFDRCFVLFLDGCNCFVIGFEICLSCCFKEVIFCITEKNV